MGNPVARGSTACRLETSTAQAVAAQLRASRMYTAVLHHQVYVRRARGRAGRVQPCRMREGRAGGAQGGCAPIARRKCSMSTSVFLTSLLYTSLPTIGQKGTRLPSSCAMPSASAVLPVPGAPDQAHPRF
jgi:hypothetical protein